MWNITEDYLDARGGLRQPLNQNHQLLLERSNQIWTSLVSSLEEIFGQARHILIQVTRDKGVIKTGISLETIYFHIGFLSALISSSRRLLAIHTINLTRSRVLELAMRYKSFVNQTIHAIIGNDGIFTLYNTNNLVSRDTVELEAMFGFVITQRANRQFRIRPTPHTNFSTISYARTIRLNAQWLRRFQHEDSVSEVTALSSVRSEEEYNLEILEDLLIKLPPVANIVRGEQNMNDD